MSLSKAVHHLGLKILSFLMVMALMILASCTPTSTSPGVQSSDSTNTGTTTVYPDPTFPISGLFVQEGGTQTTTQFSLPLNFTDSYLVRGSALSTYLKTIPNTTRFCFVSKFTYSSGSDKFLILSGKAKSYTDLANKTTEFYLQVEPSNDSSNQNDCLTYNLTTSIFTGATSPTAYFSLNQLCTSCTSAVTGQGFKLYFNNGEAVPTLNFSALSLTISASTSGSTTGSCVESTACAARGYDCCLDAQCVTDGAVRPGAILDAGFALAQIDVASNPNKFTLYPQYYFVCASRPDGDGSEDNNDPVNPDYEAAVRIMEMTQLYNCLNKVDGEFSYCTVKFGSASQNISSGIAFSSAAMGYYEDINFQSLNPNLGTGDYANNIVKIYYGGQTLYEANKTALASTDGTFTSAGNDDITTAQTVKVTKALPANAIDDNLYLTFKIDGSCQKLSASLARCSKSYTQASTDTLSPLYHDNSKTFFLPSYADTSAAANMIVKISGIVVPEDVTTWSKAQSPNRIVFSASYPLYQNQTIDITYYVSSNIANLTKARDAAQSVVNTMCICATGSTCNLNPILNSASAVTNYECVYASTTPTIPVNQTVYVSNKNVPHRYYDVNGLAYDSTYATALAQEGTAFSYVNNDLLKPSNLDTYTGYTGFNEIYGSFSATSTTAPKPAKMVAVKKDTVYDLYTNSGMFSTCLTCGSDYYTSVKKIFPPNYTAMGGGYSPDNFDSKRVSTTGTYRSDDLLYGRACFVPATMIPWTHTVGSQVKDQRRNRLAAQHFLFANGYNRDWYGFDYGSLIGSFDGLTWFSIGNQRRIKATSNKLFIAVNAYFGDQSVDSNFNVTVSETTSYSGTMPDHDTETDGAECQQSHFCATDNDCFKTVGYDYTCQNTSGLMTNWPQTDASGTEVIGGISKSLSAIVGGNNGQAKRCVYRGRGAPCHPDLTAVGTTFNTSSLPGLLACSPNNMCQPFATGSTNRFNDRIARFANTPVAQNTVTAAPTVTDTVALGARILGRPFDYYGTKNVPGSASYSLAANGLTGACIPGKNIASSVKTYDLNSSVPLSRTDSSDKILGIGPTMSTIQNAKYLNACPATDSIGVSIQQYDLNLGDQATINLLTTTQNLSTNLLDLTPIVNQNVFSSTNGSQITAVGYQRNACLRAPGASCFSDMDCAPSEFVASKVKSADLTGILNKAEENYWEEELICGNPAFKYSATGVLNTADFKIKNNFCCRDYGKAFTNYTQTETSDYQWCDTSTPGSEFIKVAGVNMPINSYGRYSRVHTGYDKMTCKIAEVGTSKTFALSVKSLNTASRYLQIQTQYKTLDTINQRTCCTQNWVRQFATTNGGGHSWTQAKMQTIDKSKFRALNWAVNNTTDSDNPTPYECTPNAYMQPSCEIRDFTQADTDLYLKFFGGLELVGIPQVALMSENFVTKINNNADITSGSAGGPGGGLPPDGTVLPLGSAGTLGTTVLEDYLDSTPKKLFSASNYNAVAPQMKKVFSESEFACCVPAGQQVPDYTTADQCCTGYVANTGSSTIRRCCLQDFTDLTVYLSRYVSSEGRGLPDSAYDPNTGYIKDPAAVELLANNKRLCCSGKAVRGVAIRRLPIPMSGNTWVKQDDAYTKRFTYLSTAVDNNTDFGAIGSIFDAGVRWNDHVYCVPSTFELPAEK